MNLEWFEYTSTANRDVYSLHTTANLFGPIRVYLGHTAGQLYAHVDFDELVAPRLTRLLRLPGFLRQRGKETVDVARHGQDSYY